MTSAGKSRTGENRFFCCWQLPSQETGGLVDDVIGKDSCTGLSVCDTEDRLSQQGVGVRVQRVQTPMAPDALSVL